MAKKTTNKRKERDVMRDAKLRQFAASHEAEREGASARGDGSIMRRAESLGSSSPIAGQVRARYGARAAGYDTVRPTTITKPKRDAPFFLK